MKKREREGSRFTIATQFALITTALLAGVIILFLIANGTFLGRFYIKKKEDALKDAFERVDKAAEAAKLTSESFEKELERICERFDIEIIIVDVDSETVLYRCNNQTEMRLSLWDKVFLGNNQGEIAEQKDEYQIVFTKDPRNKADYIEMWGFLRDDNIFLMRTAVESINEAAKITNQFILICGLIVMVVGVVIIVIVTHKMTKPILELASISERMSELDFDAKYEGKSKNEIGLLGNNFNRMSERLEKTISELKSANLELQKDIENREALEEMRSEFISSVSHELKTPIAVIQGYAEGLAEGICDDKESRDYYCSVICDEANKMNFMVKKLMTLNEIEFGEQQPEIIRLDIVTFISNQLRSAEVLLEQSEIKVQFEEENPIYVWGDEFLIEEVFMNYLTNAIHYCINEKLIKVSLAEVEGCIRVSVFNTGEQIPEENIEHLYEKFYKVDKARTRSYGGSGIGLSIVKAVQDASEKAYGVINRSNGVEFWFDIEKA